MTEATTYNEFRIETIAPDEDRWHYRHFTGAAGRDFAAVSERLAKARAESAAGAGIRYRLVRRTVLVTTTPWVEHTEVEHVPPPVSAGGGVARRPGVTRPADPRSTVDEAQVATDEVWAAR
jgi:hypothetical protein